MNHIGVGCNLQTPGLDLCCSKCGPKLTALASPGKWLEMQNFEPQLSSPELKEPSLILKVTECSKKASVAVWFNSN